MTVPYEEGNSSRQRQTSSGFCLQSGVDSSFIKTQRSDASRLLYHIISPSICKHTHKKMQINQRTVDAFEPGLSSNQAAAWSTVNEEMKQFAPVSAHPANDVKAPGGRERFVWRVCENTSQTHFLCRPPRRTPVAICPFPSIDGRVYGTAQFRIATSGASGLAVVHDTRQRKEANKTSFQ